MNHSEVGPSPGHANTAAFPFSFLMPVGRGGYPSAAADAFADLFAQLSRPQTSASRDQAATRPSQTQRPVTGNDSDPGNDDDATEDASPAPARDPLSQPLGEFDEGTPAATATPPPPRSPPTDQTTGPPGRTMMPMRAQPPTNRERPKGRIHRPRATIAPPLCRSMATPAKIQSVTATVTKRTPITTTSRLSESHGPAVTPIGPKVRGLTDRGQTRTRVRHRHRRSST